MSCTAHSLPSRPSLRLHYCVGAAAATRAPEILFALIFRFAVYLSRINVADHAAMPTGDATAATSVPRTASKTVSLQNHPTTSAAAACAGPFCAAHLWASSHERNGRRDQTCTSAAAAARASAWARKWPLQQHRWHRERRKYVVDAHALEGGRTKHDGMQRFG